MAKFEFWAKIDHSKPIVEIPDEELAGLTEEKQNRVILGYHIRWCDRYLNGDWTRID